MVVYLVIFFSLNFYPSKNIQPSCGFYFVVIILSNCTMPGYIYIIVFAILHHSILQTYCTIRPTISTRILSTIYHLLYTLIPYSQETFGAVSTTTYYLLYILFTLLYYTSSTRPSYTMCYALRKPLEQFLQSVLGSCAAGRDPAAVELPGAGTLGQLLGVKG